MKEYEKRGYLTSDFRIFYLPNTVPREFQYHYHDFDKILFFIKGDVEYYIEGKSYQLLPGDIVLVNHGEIHKLKVNSNQDYERVILYIAPEFLEKYKSDDCDLRFCFDKAKTDQSNLLRIPNIESSRMRQIVNEWREKAGKHHNDLQYDTIKASEFGMTLYQKLLILEFLIQLNRTVIANKIAYQKTQNYNRKIVEILQYINEHIVEELTIDKLAEEFYLSKYYMMRLFKAETGYTIGNYIVNKRLMLAKELLTRVESVTDVCFQCGFKEYSTFSRAFKKQFHMTPSEWKQRR